MEEVIKDIEFLMPLLFSAVERQNTLTPKLRFSQSSYLWNQENKMNVTIVVGYACLVIIPLYNDKIGITHHNSYICLFLVILLIPILQKSHFWS